MQEGKHDGEKPEHVAIGAAVPHPPTVDTNEGVTDVHEMALRPDPEGVFEIGEVISEEGDEFRGVTQEGDALLIRHDGGMSFVPLKELHEKLRALDVSVEDDNGGVEQSEEKHERPSLHDLKRELVERIANISVAENILRSPGLANKRYEYAQGFIETNIDRFVEIAAILNSPSADPRELQQLVERKIEAEKGESAPTPEGDDASQLTERSRRDEVVAFIEEGNIDAVSEEDLYRFRSEVAVQNHIARDVLLKLAPAGNIAELDALNGHDWRFSAALRAPALSAGELKQITAYLTGRMRTDLHKPTEPPERMTAIEQLRAEFGNVRFRYQGKGFVKDDWGGLDEPASDDNVRALKQDLLNAGMSADEVRKAIGRQKNRARARNDSPTKSDLEPYDLVELRRIELAKIAEREIASLGTEVTDKEMSDAAGMPPLIAPEEIRGVGGGGEQSPLIEADTTTDLGNRDEAGDIDSEGSPVAPIVSQDEPPVTESPIVTATAEEIAMFTATPTAVPGEEADRQMTRVMPTVTDVVAPGTKPFTPNQVFSHRMRELESAAEELARKSALLPSEKEALASIEQEMSDLEKKYLAERRKRIPEVELDAQGEAMMHLINSIPAVRVNMENAALGTVAVLGTAAAVTSESTPVVPPEVPVVDAAERTPISDAVLSKFNEALGIDKGTLESIPSFSELSPGKQLLILRNMQNEVLQHVTREADKTQKEEWKGRSVWGKIWNGVRTMGTYQTIRTKRIEQELLAAANGTGVDITRRAAALSGHIENIEEYVKVMEGAPEVTVKPETGEFNIAYAVPYEGNETPKNKEVLDRFNQVASRFAAIPREWGYEPKDEKEKGQYESYKKMRDEYFEARESLIAVYEQNFSKKGEADPTKEAMYAVSRISERVELDQLFNAHPDAEKAISEIEDQSAIMSGVKEFWQDKGKYIAFGAAARMTATAITGALTGGIAAPFAYMIAGGVGLGVGRAQGRNEAMKVIRKRRIDRRLSEEDEREEITYKDSKGETHKRKIKEFTDATYFTDRIERLSAKLEQSETPEERTLLESKIAKTTALMEQKLKHGLINFGGTSTEEGDERKGNLIANKLSFMEAMGKGAAVEIIDPLEVRLEMGRIIGEHQDKIETVRAKEIKDAGVKAAMIRGGFALGGAYIVGKLQESGLADEFFKKLLSYKEEVAAAVGLKESFHQYSPSDIAHLRAAVLAYRDSDYPAELVAEANRAQARALAEYMAATDPATRHAIAETMGLTEAEVDARIRHFLDIAEHTDLPAEAAQAPHPAASAASVPSAASAASAPEAAASAVQVEMVPLSRANELAREHLAADMAGRGTTGELLAQEWMYMSGKNAESILTTTKEQAIQSPGGADMWPSIYRMQAYAKANGFTAAEGYTPKSGETLEQFFLRAHAERIMRHGVNPNYATPPILSDSASPDELPTEAAVRPQAAIESPTPAAVPQGSQPRLVGGPGAIPHERTPDGGVPQRGAIGWPESRPTPSATPVEPRAVPPPPPPLPPRNPPAYPNGLPPPPPRLEFIVEPRAEVVIPPPPPRLEFMSGASGQDAALVKTNFTEGGSPNHSPEAASRTTKIADKWTEVAKDGLGKNSHWSETRNYAASYFSTGKIANGAPGSVEEAGFQMQELLKKTHAMGFRPKDQELAGAYLDRVAKELHESVDEYTAAERSRNICDVIATYMPSRQGLDPKLSAEDILSGKGIPSDQSAKAYLHMQKIVARVRENTGVIPNKGDTIDEYLFLAVRDQLKKSPTLHASSLLAPKGAVFQPTPPSPNVAPIVPLKPSIPPPPKLRWDQQA